MSIGNFEGVQAPIGEIVGLTYALEAARKYTLSALDAGIKPPVVTAMLKYWSTEIARKISTTRWMLSVVPVSLEVQII